MRVGKGLRFDRAWHRHRCGRCGKRFTDVNAFACPGEEADGVCGDCWGSGRPEWDVWADPVVCCAGNAVVASREVRLGLCLAGPVGVDWFVCGVCSRDVPFDPSLVVGGGGV